MFVNPMDLLMMPEGAALLLAYIREERHEIENWAEVLYEEAKATEKDKALYDEVLAGWMPISIEQITTNIGMSSPRQWKYLNLLKRKKLIKTKLKGLPARRWVKLIDHPNGDKK